MFLFHGSLMKLFDFATHYCCGQAREVCYILQLPMYAQLNFRYYDMEVFVHSINILGKWPLAFRRFIYLAFATRAGSPQQREPITVTFGRALTLLFSHEDWVRVHHTGDRTRNLRGERRVV